MKRITLLLSLFLIALFTYGQSYYQHPEDLEKLTAQREAAVEKIVQQTPVELKADPMDLSRTGTCPDGTFMSNSPDGGTAYTSSTDADLTNYQYYSGADMIGGISFWALQGFFDGVAWAECTSDPMDIQIKFYEDNNGEPGTEVHSETVSISPVPDPDVTFGDWTVKSFMAYLSDPVALPSGWFSVSSTNNPTCWILAINSESGTGANGYYDEGVWTPREFPQNYCFLAPLADDNAPAAPTDLTVTAAEMGELEATLAWTNPALTFSGETLTELTEINIVRDGTVIHTIDDPVIGATDSYTDNTVTEAGNYSYAVYGVNTAGDGPAVTASTYIGEDVPAAPADVTLVAVGNDGELSWTAPTEGLNGGYLSGDGITYTIVRMPGNVEVATDVTETEFLDNTVPGIGNYSYTVTASNAIGTGGSATSNTVLLGAEGILLYETFDYEIGTIPPDWFVEAELDPDGNNQGDGMENWGVNNSSSAGGTAPQMRFNWSPRFEGMSRLVTGAIDTEGNEQLRLKFRQYLSNFSVVENTLAVRVTFDGGETFETIWEHLITGNIPAEMAELYIDIPAGKETFHIAWEFNGDAYQINQWFIDDVILEPVLENDLVAMSVSGNTTPSEGMETVYTVNIQNAGTLTQSSYNVKLMQEGGVELASVAGNAIAFGETQAYELAWTPPPGSLGETFIYGYVELAGDEVPGNNQTENLDLVIQSSDILAVTIGDGELMTTQPYNMVYDYSLQQTLYYPDEIDTGGGVITGIQYVNNFDVDWPQRHIQIWLGETELENLADGWVDPSSLQLVFDGMVDFPAGENNIFIPFDDIYIYGGGNLVIYNYKMDEEWEGGKNFYNTDDPESSRTRRAQQDNDPYDPANPPTGTVTHSFPNITMFFSTAGLGALEGNVTDGTDPIEGVMVKVLGTNSSTLTDADGNYEFPYLLPETYNVEFSKFGYETVVVEGVIIEEEATTVQDAALTAIPQFTVSGNVEGNDGVLQEGAMVTLEGYDSYSATTDAEGNFTIEGVYEGTYTITVSAVGYEEYMDEALIVDQDLNLDIEVIEIIVTPFGVMVDVDNQEEGNALLMWNTGEPYFADSFEEGNLDAWYSFIQGDGTPGETGMAYWHTADYDTAPDGAKIARADWGYNIDTWLISPMIIVDDQSSVIFNWNSSYHWSVDPNPNAELMIKVSTDGGNTWEELWNWQDIGTWVNWTWYESNVSLADYAGQSVHVAVQLLANDNAETMLDNVRIGTAERSGTFALTQHNHQEKDSKTMPAALKSNKAFMGYNVFLDGNEVATEITENQYLFEELEEGDYQAGVQSVYSTGTSDIVNVDFSIVFGVPATVTVTTNSGDSPEGAHVVLTNQDNDQYVYEHTVGADGVAYFETVRKGMYTIHITHDLFHEYIVEDIDIQEEFTHTAELVEIIDEPYGLMVTTEGLPEGDAHFSWNNDMGWSESFEAGAIPEEWDQVITNTGSGAVGDFTWHVTGTVSFDDGDVVPQDGDYQVFIMWDYAQQDEWLITPEFTAPAGDLVFWYYGTNGSENGDNYYVKASTDGGDTWDILWNASDLPAGENHYATPAVIDLSAYAGQDIHLAWHNVDGDGQGLWFAWAIDNITVGGEKIDVRDLKIAQVPKQGHNYAARDGKFRKPVTIDGMNYNFAEKAFVGYNVFLNGEEVASEITETEHNFTGLPDGTHTAGVQSVYTSGVSEIMTADFTIEITEPDPVPVTFTVTDETEMYEALRIKGEMTDPEWEDIPLNQGDNHVWTVTLDVYPGTYDWGITEDDGSEFGIWLLPDGVNLEFTVDEEGNITGDVSYTLEDVGINDLFASTISMYPNPTKETVSLVSNVMMNEVRILDLSGRVVYQSNVVAREHQVNVQGFESGIYFVQIVTEQGMLTEKLQIQK